MSWLVLIFFPRCALEFIYTPQQAVLTPLSVGAERRNNYSYIQSNFPYAGIGYLSCHTSISTGGRVVDQFRFVSRANFPERIGIERLSLEIGQLRRYPLGERLHPAYSDGCQRHW